MFMFVLNSRNNVASNSEAFITARCQAFGETRSVSGHGYFKDHREFEDVVLVPVPENLAFIRRSRTEAITRGIVPTFVRCFRLVVPESAEELRRTTKVTDFS